MYKPRVRQALFFVPIEKGNITLAEMEDGHFCILKDDRPVNGLSWKHDEMTTAIAEFQQLKNKLAKPHN